MLKEASLESNHRLENLGKETHGVPAHSQPGQCEIVTRSPLKHHIYFLYALRSVGIKLYDFIFLLLYYLFALDIQPNVIHTESVQSYSTQ